MGLTVFRQIAAALAAWLVQYAATKGITLDEATILALMLATFGVVAQGLKHFTNKRGEIQPGGVSAQTTELEKMKAAR